jgi:hypothetical protein
MGEMGRLRTDVIELKEPPHDDVELLLARAPTSITLLRVQAQSSDSHCFAHFFYLAIHHTVSAGQSLFAVSGSSLSSLAAHSIVLIYRVLHARLLLDRNKMTSLLAVGVSGQVMDTLSICFSPHAAATPTCSSPQRCPLAARVLPASSWSAEVERSSDCGCVGRHMFRSDHKDFSLIALCQTERRYDFDDVASVLVLAPTQPPQAADVASTPLSPTFQNLSAAASQQSPSSGSQMPASTVSSPGS